MKASGIVCTLLPLLLAALPVGAAEPELRGSPDELSAYLKTLPGRMTLTATADLEVEADRAVVAVRVVNQDRLLQEAMLKNRAIRNDILRALVEEGVEESRIHVSQFSSTPNYSRMSGKAKSYEIEGLVTVHADNESEVQAVAAIIDEKPEVSLDSLTFENTAEEEHRRELQEKAFKRLHEQQALYEEQLGVTLRPRSVGADKERSDELAVVADYMASLDKIGFSWSIAPEGHPDIAMPSRFGQVEYRAAITVTYDLIPNDI
jgi:uncharacterized protein YggE